MVRVLEVVLGIICLYVEWTEGKVNGVNQRYSNIWVAKVRGGDNIAKRLARDLGYTYKGQVGEFKDYYALIREDHPQVSLRESDHLTDNLLDFDEVIWARQQRLVKPMTYKNPKTKTDKEEYRLQKLLSFLKNKKRNRKSKCKGLFSCTVKIPSDILSIMLSYTKLNQGDVTELGHFPTKPAPQSQLQGYSLYKTEPIGLLTNKLSAYALRYSDPYWRLQWNMQDYRTVDMPVMDHNVVPVHKMGYTGKGVTVAVVDNGVEHDCPEYKDNFIARLSYDMCTDSTGSHPDGDSHGTNCAGVIAMKPNNNLCGVGIAYDAKIVGVRAICTWEQAEYATAKALIHNLENIDIYSNSWGFYGEGRHVYTLEHMTAEALTTGTSQGRDKKGVIYVKSAGNDRDEGDNCAVDAEVNSIYIIVVAGATQWGKPAYYSERCSAVFTTAYTQGSYTEGIVAPQLNGGCYTDFSGTSASCPQVSAMIALALQAKPSLTYRDVMHLIAMSAEVAPLADNDGIWYKNGRGFWVSNDFGFGLMNAENMVVLAKKWQTVPQKRECILTIVLDPPEYLSYYSKVTVPFKTSACEGTDDEVNYLEHIELASLVEYSYRGFITVYITSPSGTTTQLLEPRFKDNDPDGLEGWSIMSTHNWGEDPKGIWAVTYKIINKLEYFDAGRVKEFTLRLHGTKTMPAHYKQKRVYAAFRLPNGQTS